MQENRATYPAFHKLVLTKINIYSVRKRRQTLNVLLTPATILNAQSRLLKKQLCKFLQFILFLRA
jgi:hypothetical protein